jgi:hypothetical protein
VQLEGERPLCVKMDVQSALSLVRGIMESHSPTALCLGYWSEDGVRYSTCVKFFNRALMPA